MVRTWREGSYCLVIVLLGILELSGGRAQEGAKPPRLTEEEQQFFKQARQQVERDIERLSSQHGKDDPRVVRKRLLLRFLKAFEGLPPSQRRLRPNIAAAARLDEESEQLYGKEQYTQALRKAREALRLRHQIERTVSELHPYYVDSLINQGRAAVKLGKLKEAEAAFARARKLLADSDRRLDGLYPSVCHNLALVYREQNQLKKADSLQTEAVDLFGKRHSKADPDTYVEMLIQLGKVREYRGDYTGAIAPLTTARKLLEDEKRIKSKSYVTVLNNLAAQYHLLGEFRAAEPLYLKVVQLKEGIYGNKHPSYALSLCNLGNLYIGMHDRERGREMIRRAYQIVADSPQAQKQYPEVYRNLLINQAHVHADDAKDDQAIDLYEKAEKSLNGEWGRQYVDIVAGLANSLTDRNKPGDWKRARQLYLSLLERMKKADLESHPAYGEQLNDLAILCDLMGLKTEAWDALKKALAAAASLAQRARYLHNLGVFHAKVGENTEAELRLHEALVAQETICANDLPLLSNRQRIDFLAGYRYALDNYLTVAIKQRAPAERVYKHILGWKGWASFLGADKQFLDHPEVKPSHDQLRSARREYVRGLLFPASLGGAPRNWSEKQEVLRRRMDELESPLVRKVDQIRSRLLDSMHFVAHAFASSLAPGGAPAGATAQQLAAMGVTGSNALTWPWSQPVTPRQLAAQLGRNVVLLDYLHYADKGEDHFLVVALAAGREPVLIPLGRAEPITKDVGIMRQRIAAQDDAGLKKVGKELTAKLLAPIAKRGIFKDVNTLLVSPDLSLHFLPFALLAGKEHDYLLEEMAVGQVGSVRQLVATRTSTNRPPTSGILAVGGVHYTRQLAPVVAPPAVAPKGRGKPDGAIPLLTESGPEATNVCKLFESIFPDERKPLLLTKDDATKRRVTQELARKWRFVHLAVHGFTLPKPRSTPAGGQPRNRPWRPDWPLSERRTDSGSFSEESLARFGLLFQGAGDWPKRYRGEKRPDGWVVNPFVNPDGVVTALELRDLNLQGTELIVLSACRTGDGDVVAGEGMFGLTHVFQQAGAATVVSSLWQVDDTATRLLMEEFYRQLGKKVSKLEALRRAQLVVRKQYHLNPKTGKLDRGLDPAVPALKGKPTPSPAPGPLPPLYWAAFVLSGDWR